MKINEDDNEDGFVGDSQCNGVTGNEKEVENRDVEDEKTNSHLSVSSQFDKFELELKSLVLSFIVRLVVVSALCQ